MNWYLFGSITLIVFQCTVHAAFERFFKELSDTGVDIDVQSNPMFLLSRVLMLLVNLNFVVFLLVFGFKEGWGIALITVFGGAATAYTWYYFLARSDSYYRELSSWHKLSWVALPTLSVGVWLILYRVLPIG